MVQTALNLTLCILINLSANHSLMSYKLIILIFSRKLKLIETLSNRNFKKNRTEVRKENLYELLSISFLLIL